jgi:hypothetical protein
MFEIAAMELVGQWSRTPAAADTKRMAMSHSQDTSAQDAATLGLDAGYGRSRSRCPLVHERRSQSVRIQIGEQSEG